MSKHGQIHWTELMTRDVDAAKAYYGSVCGWSFTEMPMPEGVYHLCMKGEEMIGGLMGMESEYFADQSPQWITYLAVDDIEQAVTQTRDAGGDILCEPFDIPEVGRIAMVRDPGGAAVGLMTPA